MTVVRPKFVMKRLSYRDLVDKNVKFEGHILYIAEVCFAHLFKLYD